MKDVQRWISKGHTSIYINLSYKFSITDNVYVAVHGNVYVDIMFQIRSSILNSV